MDFAHLDQGLAQVLASRHPNEEAVRSFNPCHHLATVIDLSRLDLDHSQPRDYLGRISFAASGAATV